MRDLFHALLLVWEYIDSDFQRPQDRRRFARELASDFGRTSRGRYSGTALMRMMLALAQRLIYCFRAADSGLSVLLFEEPAGGLTRFSGYFGQWTDVIYVTIDNDWVTCLSAERSTLVSKVTERLSCGKMITRVHHLGIYPEKTKRLEQQYRPGRSTNRVISRRGISISTTGLSVKDNLQRICC